MEAGRLKFPNDSLDSDDWVPHTAHDTDMSIGKKNAGFPNYGPIATYADEDDEESPMTQARKMGVNVSKNKNFPPGSAGYEESVDASKRAARGYKGEEWADYPDVNEAAPKSLDGEDTGVGSEDFYEPEGLKSSSAQQAIANKAQKAKEAQAEVDAFEKDAQSMAQQEPLKFKFTKSPSGDFSLSRADLKKEAPAGTLDPRLKPQPAQASAALHAKDKSQMQGVGPRPTMMDPKRDPFKPLGEAPAGTLDPRLKPQPAQASAALHGRDKSQMQGVGPKPTMTDPKRDPFKPMESAKSDTITKKEKFIKANKEAFKKRYGARRIRSSIRCC